MIEFDVKINAGDLYNYLMAHTYSGPAGLIGSCVGALMIVVFAQNKQEIFLICGIILLLYLPWTLFLKSRQMVLNNPAFKDPLHYVLDDEGITVSQNGEEQMQKWEDFYKATSTGRSIMVYTLPNSAAIFPNREMGEKRIQVVEMISKHMPAKKVHIR